VTILGAGAPAMAQQASVQVDVKISKETTQQIANAIRVAVDPAVIREIRREVLDAVNEIIPSISAHIEIASSPVVVQDRNFRATQTDSVSRTFALGPTGSLELRNISGPISVTAGSGKDVVVEIVRTARARTDADAKTGLQEVTVDVDHRGERATIRTLYPQQHNRNAYNVSVAYTVTAPPGTHVTVGGLATDTTIKGIKGDLSVEIASGSIDITGAARIALARTLSGRVSVTDVSGDSNVRVTTLSGAVTLDRVKVRQLDVDAMSGGITARDVNVEGASLKTMNGPIEYAGTVSRTGRYEMQTHNGPIRLTLSDAGGFDLDARTFAGQLKLDPEMSLRNVTLTRQALRGRSGAGGAVVVAITFAGDIVVAKRTEGAKK
jgi:DUF4097 and DUF4098 domain-containing protein YvlB